MSKYSRQHYEDVATILRAHRPVVYDGAWEELVDDFIEMFEVDNDLFDAGRFRQWIFGSKVRGMVGDARKDAEYILSKEGRA